MAYPTPSWIRPPEDPAQAYISAFSAGAQVAGAQARLQQQANAQATELAVTQQRLQQQQMRQQQEMEMTKAYHEATVGLRQQALGQAHEKIAQAGQIAANRFAAQQGYQADLAAGLKPEEAALKHPELFPSMAGFGTVARELQERLNPFKVTTETVDGQKMFYTGRNRASFAPAQVANGPIQGQPVLPPGGGPPIPGVYGVGGHPHNIPRPPPNPNKAEIEELRKAYGQFFDGTVDMPKDKKQRARIETAKKKYDALKAAGPAQSAPTSGKQVRYQYNPSTGELDDVTQ